MKKLIADFLVKFILKNHSHLWVISHTNKKCKICKKTEYIGMNSWGQSGREL